MRKNMKANKGFTLIELLIVIAVIAILAAIAIPNLLASRKAANESSAISALRTVVSAQETYRSRQPIPTYAADLTVLGTAGLVDPLLAAGSKSGFAFVCAGGTDTYTATAASSANTGDRSFFVDQTGVIRAIAGNAPPTASTGAPIQ